MGGGRGGAKGNRVKSTYMISLLRARARPFPTELMTWHSTARWSTWDCPTTPPSLRWRAFGDGGDWTAEEITAKQRGCSSVRTAEAAMGTGPKLGRWNFRSCRLRRGYLSRYAITHREPANGTRSNTGYSRSSA